MGNHQSRPLNYEFRQGEPFYSDVIVEHNEERKMKEGWLND